MTDFTSALYLGFTHAREASGKPLSLGKPSALEEPPGSRQLASQLAGLIGTEAAVMASSTLHLSWDLHGVLAQRGVEFFADQEVYPISRWGLERAAAKGATVNWFRHQDAGALWQKLKRAQRKPVIVTDGYCPACGGAPPLKEYALMMDRLGGLLLVDDTQALGLLGANGGGSLRFHGIEGRSIVVMASLAKGFGAPLACLASSNEFVERFEESSETRVHTSPPSIAAIDAGLNALRLNEREGDLRRHRLVSLVLQFRRLLRNGGLSPAGGNFPVQSFSHELAREMQEYLGQKGIRTVLQRDRSGNGASLSFLITALHNPHEIEQAATALIEGLCAMKGKSHERRIYA